MNRRLPIIAVALVTIGLYTTMVYSQTIETYFSPKGGCADAISKQLDAATKTIDIAAYELTSSPLSAKIIAAAQRGVTIRLILDRGQETEPCPTQKSLRAAGMTLKTDKTEKLQHNKYAIIDNTTVITGSYNWTDNAENANAENVVIIHDTASATAFTANFETHWGHAVPFDPHPSKKRKSAANSRFTTTLTTPTKKGYEPWHELPDPSTPTARAARSASQSPFHTGKDPARTYASALRRRTRKPRSKSASALCLASWPPPGRA